MPLAPFFAERFRLLAEATADDPSAAALWTHWTEINRSPETWTSPGVAVEDITVPGPHGTIPLRTYRPVRGEVASALLWVHGGGFEHGDLEMPEAHRVSGELALRAGAYVVSVGYRLAREGVHYPVPIDDVHAAWSWLCTKGLPADLRRPPIALGGASAGAALALATSLRTRDRDERAADALVLAYPFAHYPVPALDEATARDMAALPVVARFPPPMIERLVSNYVGRTTDLPADALPGAARLDDLPPAHIVLSEYDDLRPSGELLARQLHKAGVPVAVQVSHGMLHGHLNHIAALPQIEESLDFLGTALRQMTSGTGSKSPGRPR